MISHTLTIVGRCVRVTCAGLSRKRREGPPGAERHHEERPAAQGPLLGDGQQSEGETALTLGQQRAARACLLSLRRGEDCRDVSILDWCSVPAF